MEKYEYRYLSRAEQIRIIKSKDGLQFKLLWTQTAREEYNKETISYMTELLNELGAEGWDLVSSVPVTILGNHPRFDLWFKRLLREQRRSKPLLTCHGWDIPFTERHSQTTLAFDFAFEAIAMQTGPGKGSMADEGVRMRKNDRGNGR